MYTNTALGRYYAPGLIFNICDVQITARCSLDKKRNLQVSTASSIHIKDWSPSLLAPQSFFSPSLSIMSASPPPGIFSGVHELMINDGKFVQVANDYHVHGDMTTHVHNTSSIPSPPPAHHDTKPSRVDHKVDAVRVGGDQHIHGDYHVHYYPSRWSYAELPSNIRILTAMCRPNRPDHYHVYRGHEILFCSRFSPIYTRRSKYSVFKSYQYTEKQTIRFPRLSCTPRHGKVC